MVDDLSTGHRGRVDPRAHWHEGDVCEPGLLASLLAEHEPAVVVHLAGRVGVRRVLADPEGCRQLQETLADRVATAVGERPEGRRPRVFAASTSEVYAESREPLAEDGNLRPADGRGRWAYAGSKLASEQISSRRYRMPSTCGSSTWSVRVRTGAVGRSCRPSWLRQPSASP